MKSYLLIFLSFIIGQFYSFSQNPGDDELNRIDSLLENIYNKNEPGGSVAIVKNGEIVYAKGFGMASLELDVPNSSESVIQIGSITKQFTAVAILKLYEEKKIHLKDKIKNYIPDTPAEWNEITIEQLLSHTSGIIDLFEIPEWYSSWTNEYTPNELYQIFRNKDLLDKPGEKYHYSNAGYVLLGMIIEKVTGKSYSEYLSKIIFEPLKMSQTYVLADLLIIPKRSVGHQVTSTGFIISQYISPSHYFAGGSILTSVIDLSKWNKGLTERKIIHDSTLLKAVSKFRLNDGSYSNYGYGFSIGKMFNTLLIEHGGSTMGSNCHDMWFPADSLYIIVLNNSISYSEGGIKEKYNSRKICRQLAKICYHQPVQKNQLQNLSIEDFEKYQGVYVDKAGKPRTIYHHKNAFYWTNSKGKKFQISYIGNDTFIFEDDVKLGFETKGSDIVRAVLTIGDNKHYYTKTEKPLPEPKERKQIPELLYNQIIGKYNVGVVFKVVISKGDNSLIVDVTGQEQSVFYYERDLMFYKSDEELVTINFTKNKKRNN
jgi:CubicO group peptidase (beta-lactamase class C family)